MRTATVFTVITLVAAAPASASSKPVDYDQVESIAEANSVVAATSGALSFCKEERLRKALMDKAARDIINRGLDSNIGNVFETSVAVIERLNIFAKGVSVGLAVAQVSPQRKEAVCSSAMTYAGKELGNNGVQGGP